MIKELVFTSLILTSTPFSIVAMENLPIINRDVIDNGSICEDLYEIYNNIPINQPIEIIDDYGYTNYWVWRSSIPNQLEILNSKFENEFTCKNGVIIN